MNNIYQKEPRKLQAYYQKYRSILLHDENGIAEIINHLTY